MSTDQGARRDGRWTYDGTGLLCVHRPAPTVALSGRDQSSPGYAAVVEDLETQGFSPVVRGQGGRLAAYDEGTLVVDMVASHPSPRGASFKRFEVPTALLVDALRTLGMHTQNVGVSVIGRGSNCCRLTAPLFRLILESPRIGRGLGVGHGFCPRCSSRTWNADRISPKQIGHCRRG